jgi:hypothetical protein
MEATPRLIVRDLRSDRTVSIADALGAVLDGDAGPADFELWFTTESA